MNVDQTFADNVDLKELLAIERAKNAALRAALEGLMKFHPEDELGQTTEEYWSPEYKAAMDAARNALSNARVGGE